MAFLDGLMTDLGSGALDFVGDQIAGHQNRGFARAENQKNRDFQLMMSNTAYQRAMADMREAGLNPMLAFQQGGASTGSGSSISGVTAGTHIGTAASEASQRRADSSLKGRQEKNLDAVERNLDAQNGLIGGQLAYAEAQTREANARTQLTAQRAAYQRELFQEVLHNPTLFWSAASDVAGVPPGLRQAMDVGHMTGEGAAKLVELWRERVGPSVNSGFDIVGDKTGNLFQAGYDAIKRRYDAYATHQRRKFDRIDAEERRPMFRKKVPIR